MKLTNSQIKSVNLLFNEYKLNNNKIVDFKAPTGSGKTLMASFLCSKIFQESILNNKKTMIIIATISTAELPKSFARKIEMYKKYLPYNNFEIEYRESPTSSISKQEHIKEFILEDKKILIFGTSSFGKKRLFNEQGILDNFINESKNSNFNIIYIRDEAHRGNLSKGLTKENDYKSFDEKIKEISNFTLQMTATIKSNNKLIELSENDLKEDNLNLLKEKQFFNPFKENNKNTIGLLDEVINKFKEIKKEYLKLDFNIRPAMLIQVDSEPKDKFKKEEYYKTINLIIKKIEEANFKYLKYFGNDKRGNAREDLSLESASKNDSLYDVIIFKVGPATGWDIPRACMLVQIREVSSEQLNIQTIGRIKRNPEPNLNFNKILDKYYLYSNYQEKTRNQKFYKLKDKFYSLNVYNGEVKLDKNKRSLKEEEYIKKIKTYIFDEIKNIKNDIKVFLQSDKLEYNEVVMIGDSASNRSFNYINNIFELKLWSLSFINQNFKLLNKNIIKNLEEICKLNNINFYLFLFWLKDNINIINDIYNETIKKELFNDKYILNKNIFIDKNYSIWKSNLSNQKEFFEDVTDFKEYGYLLINNKEEKNKNIQYLDSWPEKFFLTKTLDYLADLEDDDSGIKFYSKMPTLGSNIYFEYINNDNEIKKSYIDFMLIKDGYIFMIEVKGWNDYSEQKTKDLESAYKKYLEQNPNSKLILSICYSGKKNNNISEIQFRYWDNKMKKISTSRGIDALIRRNIGKY